MQRLASRLRNPNLMEKDCQQPGVDIKKYFALGALSLGADGGGPQKKPRILGPVEDLFQKDEGEVVEGNGHGLGAKEDELNNWVFHNRAWIFCVEEFDLDMHL
jgi:hypothetical protein